MGGEMCIEEESRREEGRLIDSEAVK